MDRNAKEKCGTSGLGREVQRTNNDCRGGTHRPEGGKIFKGGVSGGREPHNRTLVGSLSVKTDQLETGHAFNLGVVGNCST